MVKSMDDVSQVAGGNADVLADIATTSRGQVESMTEMVAYAKLLSDSAEELRATLRRFDTGGRGGEETSS